MPLSNTGCLLLAALAGAHVAAAQEVPLGNPVRLFTDQVLAPRADWYQPGLAAHRVRQVTRAYSAGAAGQVLGTAVLGLGYQSPTRDRPVQEALSYDAQGYLLRYRLLVPPARPGTPTLALDNLFSYDARHQLSRIEVKGSKALLVTEDVMSSKAYARWRRLDPTFRRRHGLPESGYRVETFPDSWQLQAVLCGRARLPQAVVALAGHVYQGGRSVPVAWADTVPLDPHRNWGLATPDSLAGFADTTWLSSRANWWRPKVSTTAAGGLRVQDLPAGPAYTQYPTIEAYNGLTSFFDPAGRLRLARQPRPGALWRYVYDAQGQPLRVEAYCLHLPSRYGDTLYFGSTHPVRPIADCEHRQRQALALPDGSRAVCEFGWARELRYELNPQGLPRRAVLRTTTPRYAADVSFNELMNTVQPRGGHDGPLVHVPHWRHIQARRERAHDFLQRGCVPMKLDVADTPAIEFSYEFFP